MAGRHVQPGIGQRLFFALMPSSKVAQEITTRADTLELPGRRVATARLHLTLAFLGTVEGSCINPLIEKAKRIDAEAFTLVLDRLGGFCGVRIAWFAPKSEPALSALAARLDKNTADDIDSARYRPHVTIRRHASRVAQQAIEPIEWPVADFSLIASGEHGRPGAYRELGRWPLRAGSDEPAGL